jgi:uncharacterized membrane protein
MTVLLLSCNILFTLWTIFQLFYSSSGWVLAGFIGLELGGVLFNIAHWILAWYYYRTAVNIPEVLKAE